MATTGPQLAVKPTQRRQDTRGSYVVRINTLTADRSDLAKKWLNVFRVRPVYVAVMKNDVRAIARLQLDDRIEDAACELDQSVRERLGISDDLTDESVTIRPLMGRVSDWWRLRPRMLLLAARPAYLYDAEKGITVLHHANVELLGIGNADYVVAYAAVPVGDDEDGPLTISRVSARAFGRSTYEVRGDPSDIPLREVIRVDGDLRSALGWQSEKGVEKLPWEYPVLVVADVPRLFVKRVARYLISTAAGAIAFTQVALVAWPTWLGSIEGVATIVGASLGVTAMYAYLDIRSSIGS